MYFFFLSFNTLSFSIIIMYRRDISHSSPENQNQWDICISLYIYMIYCKELAHGIMETEKSHDLQAGDPRKPVV